MNTSSQAVAKYFQQSPIRRRRHAILSAALGNSPLGTCFTTTGFLIKSAQWTEPTLANHQQVTAVLTPGSLHICSLARLREAIHAETAMRRLDLSRVIDCALHVCVKHSRPVRYQVALGAFHLVSALNGISELKWGKPLPVDKKSVHLKRLGIPGIGPLTWTQIANIYEDVLCQGAAYTSPILTVSILGILRDILMNETHDCPSVEHILGENKNAACAILGVASRAFPRGIPKESGEGNVQMPSVSTTLKAANEVCGVTLNFVSPDTFATFCFPKAKQPWVISFETFSAISAATLADASSICAYGSNIGIRTIRERQCVQIATAEGSYQMQFETFRKMQSLLTQVNEHPVTACWTRFFELTCGIY